jgi:hypothetical protein
VGGKNVVNEAMSSAADSRSRPTEPWRPLGDESAHASIAGRARDESSPVASASVPTRWHDVSGAAGAASRAGAVSRAAMATWASQQVAVGNSPEATEDEQHLERGSPAAHSFGETPRFRALSDRWDREAAAPLDVAGTEETQKYLLESARALGLKDETVSSAECRTTVCRARLQFSTLKEAAAFEQAAQQPDLDYELKNKPSDRGAIEVEVLLKSRVQP